MCATVLNKHHICSIEMLVCKVSGDVTVLNNKAAMWGGNILSKGDLNQFHAEQKKIVNYALKADLLKVIFAGSTAF